MSENFDIYHEFKVLKKNSFSGEDYASLTRLYLPLIGLDAFGFYHFLLTLPEDKFFTHKLVYDSLGLVDQRIINSARQKLEAVGLIDTYVNTNGDKVTYVMKRPLTFDEFDSDIILSSVLRTTIGNETYEKLIKDKDTSLRGYRNISKKFNDVFTVDKQEDVLQTVVKSKLARGVQFDNSFFDYLIFKEILGTSLLGEELLEDKEFKDNIYRIAYIFKLNEEEMKEAVILTIELDKDFNYDCLMKNAKKIFQTKNQGKEPVLITTKNDAFVRSTGDSKIDQVIYYFNTTHPRELLQELSGINPSVAELEMINDLIKNTNFPIGVINVMISMVSTEKEGILPGYNYFEKIANTWARAGIKTTEDALNYITQRRTKPTSYPTPYQSKPTSKRVAKTPEWYEEYEQTIENYAKERQNDNLTELEKQRIIEEAKKLLS